VEAQQKAFLPRKLPRQTAWKRAVECVNQIMDIEMKERFTAEQLANWRKGYGWTQEYAAGRLGLTVHGYVKKEQNKRRVNR
jgi:DNA-binding XRE family transcriptional regulator